MSDKFWLWLARRLPRRLAYWTVIDAGSVATTGVYGNTVVPDLTFMDALKRIEHWERPSASQEVPVSKDRNEDVPR